MKWQQLKSYLKYSYPGILLSLLITSLIVYFSTDKSYWYFLYNLAYFIQGYFQYGDRMIKIKQLKSKGLTEEDLHNIQFVKKWEQTREAGKRRYCFSDGGIVAGAVICFVFCLAFISIKSVAIFDGPGKMFSIIGYSYLAGFVIGSMLYRILWNMNEKKFKRLTDPFYQTLTTSVKA